MTPVAHTLYSVALFLALGSFLLWLKRRDRAQRRLRENILTTLANSSPESAEVDRS